MKKHGYFACAALTLTLAAAPLTLAHAQMMPGFKLNEGKEVSPEEKERMQANERAAKDAQSSIPTPKASNDPWATVRSADAPPAPKAKKPKAVTH